MTLDTCTDAIYHLMERGLVSPNDIIGGDFSAIAIRSRNSVFQILRRNVPLLYVKSLLPQGWSAELSAYKAFIGDPKCVAIRKFIPFAVDVDARRRVIVTQPIQDAMSLFDAYRTNAIELDLHFSTLGDALRELHSLDHVGSKLAIELNSMESDAQWILSIGSDHSFPVDSNREHVSSLCDSIANDAHICAFLGRVLMELSESRTAIVHGDLKWTNIVLGRTTSDGRNSVHLIDWESVSIGTPHWDLGCVLSSWLLMELVLRARNRPASLDPLGRDIVSAVASHGASCVVAFLRSYFGPSWQENKHKVLLCIKCAIARLLQAAIESCADGSNELEGVVPLVRKISQHEYMINDILTELKKCQPIDHTRIS